MQNRDKIFQAAENKVKANDLKRAKDLYKQFLAASKKPHPMKHLAWYNLGVLTKELANPTDEAISCRRNATDEAIFCYKKALEENPSLYQARLEIGNCLTEQNRFQEAMEQFGMLGANDAAYRGMALCLVRQEKFEESLTYFNKSLQLNPTPDCLDQAAFAYFATGRRDVAARYQEQAFELSQSFDHFMNLGDMYKKIGETGKAVDVFAEAVAQFPASVDCHLHYAFALFLHGDLRQGWREYEWRRKKKGFFRVYPIPYWSGESLNGKKLFLYGEQGFGDTLQFARFIPVLKRKYKDLRIVFQCHAALTTLLKNFNSIDAICEYGENAEMESCDFHCSIMSLPCLLNVGIEDIPNEPYIKISASDKWIFPKEKLKIGLVWHGGSLMNMNAPKKDDELNERRNAPLSTFKNLIEKHPEIQFYSLQKGDAKKHIAQENLQEKILDYTDEFKDFKDTASFIEGLDLIMGVDTGVMHLAAAMGKKTWMLLRIDGDWRWTLKFENNTPWYPSMRLFRQTKWKDWSDAARKMEEDLDSNISLMRPMLI